MKVIINSNGNKDNNFCVAECEHCESVILVNKEDIEYGEYGLCYCTCPVCGERMQVINEAWEKKLTIENLEYPKDFNYCNFDDNDEGIKRRINDSYIQARMKEMIKELREDKKENFKTLSGDGYIIIVTRSQTLNIDDCLHCSKDCDKCDKCCEYYVVVSKDYWEILLNGEELFS